MPIQGLLPERTGPPRNGCFQGFRPCPESRNWSGGPGLCRTGSGMEGEARPTHRPAGFSQGFACTWVLVLIAVSDGLHGLVSMGHLAILALTAPGSGLRPGLFGFGRPKVNSKVWPIAPARGPGRV